MYICPPVSNTIRELHVCELRDNTFVSDAINCYDTCQLLSALSVDKFHNIFVSCTYFN